MSATTDKNEMDLNKMSKEELMKYLMNNMEKKEVNNIIKECNKKVKEKKYINNECINNGIEEEEDKEYRITDKEAYVKYILKDKERLNNLLTYAFNEDDFNNFKLEELEIKNDSKTRKPDNMDEDTDGIRCVGMVWGGGKGGRCKCKYINKETRLCKLHYESVINKKRLLAYGHYDITGEYSVPDLDGKNLRRDLDYELEYTSINDILLLKPLNAELFNLHKKHYKKSVIYNDDMKCFNDYMDILEITDKEKKRLYKYYDPNLTEHKNPINEIMNVEPEEEEEEIVEETEEEEKTDAETEEEEEEEPNELKELIKKHIIIKDNLNNNKNELEELNKKKRKSKDIKNKIETLEDNIIKLNEDKELSYDNIKKLESNYSFIKNLENEIRNEIIIENKIKEMKKK